MLHWTVQPQKSSLQDHGEDHPRKDTDTMQFLFRCKYDNNYLVFIEMQTEFLWLKWEDIWGNHPWFVGLKVSRYLDEKKNS